MTNTRSGIKTSAPRGALVNASTCVLNKRTAVGGSLRSRRWRRGISAVTFRWRWLEVPQSLNMTLSAFMDFAMSRLSLEAILTYDACKTRFPLLIPRGCQSCSNSKISTINKQLGTHGDGWHQAERTWVNDSNKTGNGNVVRRIQKLLKKNSNIAYDARNLNRGSNITHRSLFEFVHPQFKRNSKFELNGSGVF
jgi:hypothetical protein